MVGPSASLMLGIGLWSAVVRWRGTLGENRWLHRAPS
jgi:cytochrome d ubiquinol oxidase subunit I